MRDWIAERPRLDRSAREIPQVGHCKLWRVYHPFIHYRVCFTGYVCHLVTS
jgi:hypothetical protein